MFTASLSSLQGGEAHLHSGRSAHHGQRWVDQSVAGRERGTTGRVERRNAPWAPGDGHEKPPNDGETWWNNQQKMVKHDDFTCSEGAWKKSADFVFIRWLD